MKTFVRIVTIAAALLISACTTLSTEEPDANDVIKLSRLIDSKLLLPLTYNKEESPALIAITYEYCAEMELGTHLAGTPSAQRATAEFAKKLVGILSDNGHADEAIFYSLCSFRKWSMVRRR